jgi:two-component system, NarL family, response regulator LiaR
MWLDAVEAVLTANATDVVGKSTSLSDATRLIGELRPDFVVVETEMSDGETTGIEWVQETVRAHPEVKLIALSSSEQDGDIQSALASGAVAFVIKKAYPDDLALAIRQVYEHSIYLPQVADGSPADAFTIQRDRYGLTRRELEILQLVAEGLSNAELAARVRVTEQTVKFHLSNIYKKLGVSNRTEAARWAQIHGFLSADAIRPIRAA